MPKFTKEELEMLSPEERAGVQDTSEEARAGGEPETAAEVEAPRAKVTKPTAETQDDGAETDDEGDEGDGEDEAEKAPAAKTPAKTKPAADADDGDEESDEDDDGEAPVIATLRLPEAAARDFKKERADLKKAYDEGEVSQDDYDAKRDDITRAEAKADFSNDINNASAAATWAAEQKIFFKNFPQFNDESKPGLRAALDAQIERIDAETKGSMSGYELLNKARKAVNTELGFVPARADDGDGEQAPAAKPSAKRPVPTREAATKRAIEGAPKTLAEIPNAEDGDTGEGKYASLDALANKGGMAFEQALARLSPSEREEYLSQQ